MNIRKTAPAADNKYYLKKPFGYNPCILGNENNRQYTHSVLADCTGYVVGRFGETQKDRCNYISAGYPGTYIKTAKAQGLEVGTTPKNGCIIVMVKSDGLNGHVMFCEKASGGKYYISESGWHFKKGLFMRNRWTSKAANFGMSSDYKFTGCIYNPNIDPYDIPPATFSTRKEPKNKPYVKFVQWVLVREECYKDNTNIEIDGSAGARTVEAIKVYQKKHGLAIDGSAGPKTCAVMINDHALT